MAIRPVKGRGSLLTSRASDRDITIIRMGDGEAVEIDTDSGSIIEPDDTIRIRPRRF